MIAFSSRLALRDLLADLDRHHGQRWIIYQAIHGWSGSAGPSREDIARVTGLRLTSVCGRVKELLDAGVVLKGPYKRQEVVPGRALDVETLVAFAYREPVLHQVAPTPQMELAFV